MTQMNGDDQNNANVSGLQRSDQEILDDINRRIQDDPFLKKQDVRVSVSGGVVTLDGTVASPMARDLADELASGVSGVRSIQNYLQTGVTPTDTGTPINTGDHDSVGDVTMSEDPNTRPIHSDEMKSDEVTPFTVEGAIQYTDVPIPSTGPEEGIRIRDGVYADDTMRVTELDEDSIAKDLQKGMAVVDKEGKKIGKVKEVRTTDFLLGRLLHRDLYVPYLACTYDGQNVVINVPADQINDQGWASP